MDRITQPGIALTQRDPHAASILLIEDNSSDETLACRILRQSGYTNITVIRDGAQALDYLLGLNEFATRRTTDLPVLTLLELDLPTIGGIDVLKAIRADPNTMFLPVVILTGSPDEKDRHAARDAGANGYILKPYDLDELSHDLTALVDYWMITLYQPSTDDCLTGTTHDPSPIPARS